jgi:iron-sulfur cluster repair protein YtfE (RIC family)
MLQGCHVRIRHFMQLGRTLAESQEASQEQIAAAADDIFRYFSQALPLHEADENETLFPRFRDAGQLGSPLRQAARAMVEQHHAIDELVAELLSLCGSLRSHPEGLPSLARQLRHVSIALDQIFASHLDMEETVIFPAIAQLPAEELEAMSREMQQRRRPPEDAIHLVR